MAHSKMSEGATSPLSTFGLASVKAEGSEILYDGLEVEKKFEDETFWFEHPFTKAQYTALAEVCQSSSELFIRELAQEFSARAVNGYGEGF